MSKHNKRTKQAKTEETVYRLRRELDKERRHSAALEREVALLKQELKLLEERESDTVSLRLRRQKNADPRLTAGTRMREASSRRAHHYRRNSYLRYLFESMMESLPVRIISTLLFYLRRLRVVRVIATVVAAVGTVALVTVLSAALLPILFFGTAFLAIWAGVRSRRMNRILRQELDGKHLRVFLPPRGTSMNKDSFFLRQARAMAADERVAVLIVSPYSLSRKGAGKKRFYFTARRDAENLYMVRRPYFFFVRKRVLDVADPDMTVIY